MQELKPWSEIFKIRLFDYAHVQERLIAWIQHYTPQAGSIFEVGFGSGWTSILLAQLGYNVYSIDIDKMNVLNAMNVAEVFQPHLNFCFFPVFSYGDLFDFASPSEDNDGVFHLGFSDGVFEHFGDGDVIKGLCIMKEACKIVIVDVPSWKERNAVIKRGDEIYRTNREWKRLIHKAGFKIKHIYGSVVHCPRWIRAGLPPFVARRIAHHFTTKVGFIL